MTNNFDPNYQKDVLISNNYQKDVLISNNYQKDILISNNYKPDNKEQKIPHTSFSSKQLEPFNNITEG